MMNLEKKFSTLLSPMKFSCATPQFLTAIQLVSRAIGSQQALPILGNILIQIKEGTCTLTATDLEVSIITSVPANSESEGSVTVPAKALLNFMQYNSDPEVLFEVKEGTRLSCTSKRAKAMIAGEAAAEYPTIAEIEKVVSFSLDAAPLLHALHLVTFAAAKTSLRPVLSGVSVRSVDGKIILVATDSYRLSECTIPTDGGSEQISCIIPAKILDEVRSVLATTKGEEKNEGNSRIAVAMSKQQIEIRMGQTRLISRLIEGKFPNYEQIVPKDHGTRIRFVVGDLAPAIKRMHYFAKEVNNTLTFHVQSSGQVRIATPQTSIGKDEAEFTAEVDGADTKIALSSTYLLDFLNHIDSSDVEMRMTDAQKPAVFVVPGDVQYMHLIMPLRMTEE